MYAATIEGKVHYFAFKANDVLYSSVEDKLPKRAIAIAPSGEIIQSVRNEFLKFSNHLRFFNVKLYKTRPVLTRPPGSGAHMS